MIANSKDKEKDIRRILLPLLTLLSVIFTLNLIFIRYTSDFILPLTKAIFLMLAVFINGAFICSHINKKINIAVSIGYGIIFTSFYFFFLAFFKGVTTIFILIYFLLIIPTGGYLLKKRRKEIGDSLKLFFNMNKLQYLIFIFPLIYASLPSTFYDTLVYHLGVPNQILQYNGFIKTPFMVYANTSLYYELSLVPSIFLGDLVPRLFHFLLSSFFILYVVQFAKKQLKLKKTFLLLLVLISTPVSFFLITTVKNDIIGAFFILLAIERYLEKDTKISALFWGFSIGIKYFNALPFVLFVLLTSLKSVIKNKRFGIKDILDYIFIVPLILLPLFIKNFIYINNPFFPFLNNIFNNNPFDSLRYKVMQKDVGKIIKSFKDFFFLPYTISFKELGSGGITGALLIAFLPFMVITKKNRHKWLFFFAVLLIFTGALFTGSLRFLYISIVLLLIYATLIYEELEFLNKKILTPLFFILIILNIFSTFGLQERIYKANHLFSGKYNKEMYKKNMLVNYQVTEFVNKNTPLNTKFLIIGEARNYYLKRKYIISSALDYSIVKKYISPKTDFKEFINNLQQDKIDYILFNQIEFERLNKHFKKLSEQEANKFFGFLEKLKGFYKDDFCYIFEVPKD